MAITTNKTWSADQAKNLQRMLNNYGFTDNNGNKLSVDGVIGPKTQQALAKMNTYQQHLEKPDAGVAAWQGQLNDWGYTDANGEPLKVDGIHGPKTDAATNSFENGFFDGFTEGTNQKKTVPTQTFPTMPKASDSHIAAAITPVRTKLNSTDWGQRASSGMGNQAQSPFAASVQNPAQTQSRWITPYTSDVEQNTNTARQTSLSTLDMIAKMNKIADNAATDNIKQRFENAVYRYDTKPGESIEDAYKRTAKPFDTAVYKYQDSRQNGGYKPQNSVEDINKFFNDYNRNAGLDKSNFMGVAYKADDPDVQEAIGTFLGKTLIGNPAAVYITQQGLFPEVFDQAGFFRTEDGIYHAKFDSWQAAGGYNDYYNDVFDYFTDMDQQPFDFIYNGQKLRLWAWKGDYLNLGAGAEMGIYKDSGINIGGVEQYSVDKENLKLPMELTLKAKDKTLYTYAPNEDQWWITGFDPSDQNAKAADLTAYITIDFTDHKNMYDAFIQSRQYIQQKANWTADPNNKYRLTYKF